MRQTLVTRLMLSTILLVGPGVLDADVIRLKNGRRMTGKIVKQTAEGVVLDVGSGKVTVSFADIASIEFDAEAPTGLSSRAGGSVSRTVAAPVDARTPPPQAADRSPHAPSGASPGPTVPPSSGQALLLNQSAPAPEELKQLAEEILPVVSELRGLPPKAPIEKRVVDKATIRQAIQREIARQHSEEELTNKGKALIKLGLLPASVNLKESILHLYTNQVAGMYDPHTKTLYLADWIPATLQAQTVAHELVHALQDQHFNLVRYLDEAKGDSEAVAARQAIVEGEALAVMLDYQLKDQGLRFTDLGDLSQWVDAMLTVMQQMNPGTSPMPTYLEESLLFPYVHGMGFLQLVRSSHPWSWVAQLYRDPPRSTEQLMHPGKYLTERDDPTVVQLTDVSAVLGSAWSKIDEDVLGEFSWRSLLRQFTDGETAAASSAGWDGDRYHLYEETSTKRLALVVVSVWDSVRDAQEFLEAYRRVIEEKYLQEAPVGVEPNRWRTEDGDVRLERRNTAVLIIEGVPAERLADVVSRAWQSVGSADPAATARHRATPAGVTPE